MNKAIVKTLALVGVLGFGASAQAQHEGPLVDALVKKGVLTSQEGEEIRADLTKEYASLPGGKLDFGKASSITKLKLYGDVRFRFQLENDRTSSTTSDHNQEYRYRVRLGADYTFVENWKAGVRVSTQSGNNSTNADFSDFFGKTNGEDDLYIDLAYLNYSAKDLFDSGWFDKVELRMGKHKHPFFLSKSFWDSDTNPEGFSQIVGWNDAGWNDFDVTFRSAQYIIASEDNGDLDGDDAWMFMGQLEGKYSFGKKEYVRVAPTIMHTFGAADGTEDDSVGGFAGNEAYFNNMTVFMLPAEVKWKAFDLPWQFYGTYGINVNNDTTARAAGNQLAQLGIKVGSAKKKGTWQISTDFNYIEGGSYTVNLIDSDFHDGNTGGIGYRIKAKYAFTDFIYGGVSWLHSWEINADGGNSATGISTGGGNGSGATAAAGANGGNDEVGILQVDLNYKF